MATVYRARDVKHGRTVAVKVLRSDLGELIGPDRFLREIEIAARQMHPHILALYDSGRANGPPGEADTLYYVMPFVADESLRGVLNRVRLMDRDGAVEIVRRLASALDYAHASGILHRDIKPEYILLPGGQAVLADFGIAKAVSSAAEPANLTRTGIALGTPGYMSPEQAAGVMDLRGPRTSTVSAWSRGCSWAGCGPGPPDVLAAGRSEAAPDHRLLLDWLFRDRAGARAGARAALGGAVPHGGRVRLGAGQSGNGGDPGRAAVGRRGRIVMAWFRERRFRRTARPGHANDDPDDGARLPWRAHADLVSHRPAPAAREHDYLSTRSGRRSAPGYGTARTTPSGRRAPKKLVSAFDFEEWESAQDGAKHRGPHLRPRTDTDSGGACSARRRVGS
jgi:hypothetical protein